MFSEGAPKRLKQDTDSQPVHVPRSIDACQRCRLKKIKCDQKFPSCLRCIKSNSECKNLDRTTGRIIPRSYVHHLETKVHHLEMRVQELETQLAAHEKRHTQISPTHSPAMSNSSMLSIKTTSSISSCHAEGASLTNGEPYLGECSGITFAKLITAAVKMNVQAAKPQIDTSINPPTLEEIQHILPPKATAQDFIWIYFTHSNSQLPILHREAFLTEVFEPIYGSWDDDLSPSSKQFSKALHKNTVLMEETWLHQYKKVGAQNMAADPTLDAKSAFPSRPSQVPKKHHRALFYLNMVFGIASSVNLLQYHNCISEQFRRAGLDFSGAVFSSNDRLENLQAKLLVALFSLMRPSDPGIWYVLGPCLRLCVDLGLHKNLTDESAGFDAFTKDVRRRLFWCTYSLDRQVCFYMGRPVGIPESSIKTPFPSVLDDEFIIAGSPEVKDYSHYSSETGAAPSYKLIAIAFFRIRMIQSEVQRILYEDEQLPQKFQHLSEWKNDMQEKLDTWSVHACELNRLTGVEFNSEFLGLNYNHTVLMLNGLSPRSFELTPEALMKVADASRNLIRCYTLLYTKKAINYTWAGVHNLYVAGTSFLYALYSSEHVKESYSKEMVKSISQECITVLSSLVDSCSATTQCLHMFRILSTAVLKISYKESGDSVGSIKDGRETKYDEIWTTHMNKPMRAQKHIIISPQQEELAAVCGSQLESLPRKMTSLVSTPELWTGSHVNFEDTHLEELFQHIENGSPHNKNFRAAHTTFTGLESPKENLNKHYPTRDAKQVYDCIQFPTDIIWHQYFGNFSGNPVDPNDEMRDNHNHNYNHNLNLNLNLKGS